VQTDCFTESPSVSAWMAANGIPDGVSLQSYFWQQAGFTTQRPLTENHSVPSFMTLPNTYCQSTYSAYDRRTFVTHFC
jgi:hypothetical protein